MIDEKERFIFELNEFMDHYDFNEHLYSTALASRWALQELIDCYFHDDTPEAKAIQAIVPILSCFLLHVERRVNNVNS